MDIFHDFIATKTCSGYEFLVVYGQVRVGMVCGAGRVRVRSAQVRGGFKFCGCGHKVSNRAGL